MRSKIQFLNGDPVALVLGIRHTGSPDYCIEIPERLQKNDRNKGRLRLETAVPAWWLWRKDTAGNTVLYTANACLMLLACWTQAPDNHRGHCKNGKLHPYSPATQKRNTMGSALPELPCLLLRRTNREKIHADKHRNSFRQLVPVYGYEHAKPSQT